MAIRDHFRGLDNQLGGLLALTVGELLTEASICQARTVDQLLDRRAVLAL